MKEQCRWKGCNEDACQKSPHGVCAPHEKTLNTLTFHCCGGNDEIPPEHCMDCVTRNPQSRQQYIERNLGVAWTNGPKTTYVGLGEVVEKLRRKFLTLQRHSFLIEPSGGVRRVGDRSGRWVDADEVHALFDVVVVEALFTQVDQSEYRIGGDPNEDGRV